MINHKRIHTVSSLISLFIILILIVSGAMIPAHPTKAAALYVDDIGSATDNNAGTSLVITVGGEGVSADNTIIVGFASPEITPYTEPVITDDGGNTYTLATHATNVGHGHAFIYYAYAATALSSGESITITTASIDRRAAVAGEFNGLVEASVLDQSMANPTVTTVQGDNPSVGPTGTTVQANELIIGVIGTEEAADPTVDTWQNGFTAGPQAKTSAGTNDWRVSLGYLIVSTTGQYTAAKTVNNNPFWAATIATFRAANVAPVVTDIEDQTIAEGASFTTVTLDDYVSDEDNTDEEMTWTCSGNIELTVDITDRVATITAPTPDWYGTEVITFTATDPGSLWDENPATFEITAVNDAPVVTDIPDETIAEGGSFATISLDNYVSDVDNSDEEMTWTHTGNSELTVDITDRVATITTPSADWNGDETITFRATDPGSLWDENPATFTVSAENDAPVVTGIPDQTIAEGDSFTTINLDDYVSDADNDDDEMSWSFSGESELTVDITDRVATISIPNTDWNGDETITFRATDPGSLWGEDAATFEVTAVNDDPVVTDILDQTIPHGASFATINLDDYVSDIDNDDDEMSWSFSGNSELSVDITARVATISKPGPNWSGSETITFRATDPGSLYDQDAVTFTVSDPTQYNVTVSVTHDTDDSEERVSNGAINLWSDDLELTWERDDGGFEQIVGVRFRNVQVPAAAMIESAYIEFETDELAYINPSSLTIYGQAADTPVTFSEAVNNISDRPLTSASVLWEPDIWSTADERHQTADLSTVVQEIVNRGGWISGNSMAFIVEGDGLRIAKAYEFAYDSAQAPSLVISYTISAGPTIAISDIPLSHFDSAPGVPSAVQSYVVSGSNLTGNIHLTAPSDFEISTSSSSGYGPSLSLPQSGGSVYDTIYVRFNRATVGSSSGDITHTSAGAYTRNLEVSGTAANIITESFQDGVSGYSGTLDTFIRGIPPHANTNYSSDTFLEWYDGWESYDEVTLIRFSNLLSTEGGPILVGSTIISASLRYRTISITGDPADVYESLVNWPEATVTWNNFGGEAGVQGDEYANLVASAPTDVGNTYYTIDVTDSLVRWSANPSSHLGWIFISTGEGDSTIWSSDSATTAYHPQLTVIYSGESPPTCYPLTLGHTGNGSNPVADPPRSAGCLNGEYAEGEIINLSAVPDTGWDVDSWTNTNNDSSTESTNTVTMPAGAHSALVNYTDTTAPETVLITYPDDPTSSVNASFTFTSTEVGSTFECQLDGGGFSACSSPQDYTSLADGAHTFEVQATDLSNNTDPTPASHTWTVDTIAPDTSITDNPPDPSNSADASFSFTSTEVGPTFECQLNGGGFTTCTSPQAYTGLADGAHTFEVQATDAVGHTDPTPASHTWTIDTVVPDTSITDNPPDPSDSADASFSFTSTEIGSTFECRLDDGGFSTCTSPQNYTGLADGAHTFDVRATDPAGNPDSSPASYGWEIDTVAPDTSITDSPSDPSNSADASFSFTSTEVGSTFECQLDDGGFSACTSPQAYTGLADDPHTFDVRAIDPVGNPDSSPASYGWEIDTVAPDTSITDNPSDPSNSTDTSFSFTSTEVGSTFECQLDGGGFGACSSPQNYTGLADGAHTFEVQSTDLAGNTDPIPASYSWAIDTVEPETSITTHPDDPSDSSDASFTFASTEVGSTYECRLDSGGFSACTSPQEYTLLSDGNHTFEVQATDPAGNTDPTPASYDWEIDTVVPNTGITDNPPDPSNSADASFSFTSTKPGSTFECQLDGGGFSACTSPQAYTGLADGAHTFEVQATDPVGNTDPTPASYDWEIDTVAPNTNITAYPDDLSRDLDPSFSFTSTEAGSTFECQLDGGGFSACTSPQVYTNLAYGIHTFDVRATDPAGNTDQTPASDIWMIVKLIFLPLVRR